MEASSAGTNFDDGAKPTGVIQVAESVSPGEVSGHVQRFVASHEDALTPVAEPPALAQPAPEAQVTPDPVAAKVFLSDGQVHLLADRAELVGKLTPSDSPPADWLILTRQNGSTITVRETAIVAFE